ncbi:MAG TPA: hypothetical protein VGQ76_05335 [Thermoanaerobaculia bacterium]|nr:hypothetical protein [Thermoanaerobaculia bacterium]
MILYRKAAPLRVRRSVAPAPPFWSATAVAPYGARRAAPVAIDYLALRATGVMDKLEVGVSDNVRDELERSRMLTAPVLIDAAETAEVVFRRGEEVLEFCEEQRVAAVYLVSTRGGVPLRAYDDAVVVISAWPLELGRLEELFAEAKERGLRWGVAVPVLFPVTTDLAPLETLADAAQTDGASFLAAMSVEMEPTAKQALAQTLNLDADDDRYAMLFHAALEPVHLATERHIAALAHERGMADFIVPPRWDERSNWNAAVLLTLAASRMIAMELDLDLAGTIAKSARVIAELDKPLVRIFESASLSIIGGLDDTSAEALTSWMADGTAEFCAFVDEQWRMRRGRMMTA